MVLIAGGSITAMTAAYRVASELNKPESQEALHKQGIHRTTIHILEKRAPLDGRRKSGDLRDSRVLVWPLMRSLLLEMSDGYSSPDAFSVEQFAKRPFLREFREIGELEEHLHGILRARFSRSLVSVQVQFHYGWELANLHSHGPGVVEFRDPHGQVMTGNVAVLADGPHGVGANLADATPVHPGRHASDTFPDGNGHPLENVIVAGDAVMKKRGMGPPNGVLTGDLAGRAVVSWALSSKGRGAAFTQYAMDVRKSSERLFELFHPAERGGTCQRCLTPHAAEPPLRKPQTPLRRSPRPR